MCVPSVSNCDRMDILLLTLLPSPLVLSEETAEEAAACSCSFFLMVNMTRPCQLLWQQRQRNAISFIVEGKRGFAFHETYTRLVGWVHLHAGIKYRRQWSKMEGNWQVKQRDRFLLTVHFAKIERKISLLRHAHPFLCRQNTL